MYDMPATDVQAVLIQRDDDHGNYLVQFGEVVALRVKGEAHFASAADVQSYIQAFHNRPEVAVQHL